MIGLMLWFALLGVLGFSAFWFIGVVVLQGPDLSAFDRPQHAPTGTRTAPSPEHGNAVAALAAGAAGAATAPAPERLRMMREMMDRNGENLQLDATITNVDAGGVPAEWMIAPGADPDRRILYIHGGAFVVGSPKSHRAITHQLSSRCGAAVLAIDYRLMPENRRAASIEDSQLAYRWILENGPSGAGPPTGLVVAGDSAGGNLTLMTIAWARDESLRAADAVVVLSPATDATMDSPSLKRNLATDVMLGPLMKGMVNTPRVVLLWYTLLTNRINPRHPIVSPLRGDLSRLPPTLVQASLAEMLLDDAVRYVNKANASGSVAILQTWPFMLHVWQAFIDVPEAKEAWDHIEQFLAQHLPEPITSSAQRA